MAHQTDEGHSPDNEAPVEIEMTETETEIEIIGVERRAALKMLGLGALGAVPLMAAPTVIDRFIARGRLGHAQ